MAGIRIDVTGADKATPALRNVSKELDALGKRAAAVGQDARQLAARERELAQAAQQARGSLGGLESDLAGLVKSAAGAYAGIQGLKMAFEWGREAAAFTDLTRGFDTMAGRFGADSQKMLADMRAVSKGTIDDARLTEMAMKGLALTSGAMANDMGKAMGLARAAAAAGLGDAATLFDNLLTAIGRGSTEVLDNLGIVVDLNKAYEDHAAKLGITVEQMSKADKQQALLNATFAAAGKTFGDFAAGVDLATDKYDQLTVKQEEFKQSIGGVANSILGVLLPPLAAGADALQTFFDIAGGSAPQMAEPVLAMGAAYEQAQLALTGYQQELAYLTAEHEAGRVSSENFAAASAYLTGRIAELQAQVLEARRAIDLLNTGAVYGPDINPILKKFGVLEWQASLTAQNINRMLGMAWAAGQIAGPAEAPLKVSPQQAYAMRASQGQGARTFYDQRYEAGQGMQRYLDARSKAAQAAIKKGAAGMRSALKEEEKALKDADAAIADVAKDFQSKIGDLFKATTPQAGDEGKPDRWDEYARRVRAAVQDANSEWRKLIPADVMAKGQEAISAWGSAELKAFYAGQRPGEINWAAVKEMLAPKGMFEDAVLTLTPEIVKAGQAAGVDLVSAFKDTLAGDKAANDSATAMGSMLMSDKTIAAYQLGGQKLGDAFVKALNEKISGSTLSGPKVKIEVNVEAGVPGLQHGTPYVPYTGLYRLHQGERVVPAGQNSRGGYAPQYHYTINAGSADAGSVLRRVKAAESWDRLRGVGVPR